jgi:hypothetical protein
VGRSALAPFHGVMMAWLTRGAPAGPTVRRRHHYPGCQERGAPARLVGSCAVNAVSRLPRRSRGWTPSRAGLGLFMLWVGKPPCVHGAARPLRPFPTGGSALAALQSWWTRPPDSGRLIFT